MGECLLTTRGEKGDTGPKGDPGTPTLSQAMSMLGLQLGNTKRVNNTFTIPYQRYSSDYPVIILQYTEKSSDTSTPLVFIHTLTCTAKGGTGGGHVTIYTSGWINTSDSYNNHNPIFNVSVSANENKTIGTQSNIAVTASPHNGHGRYLALYGFGSAHGDGNSFSVTLSGTILTYYPTWATVK